MTTYEEALRKLEEEHAPWGLLEKAVAEFLPLAKEKRQKWVDAYGFGLPTVVREIESSYQLCDDWVFTRKGSPLGDLRIVIDEFRKAIADRSMIAPVAALSDEDKQALELGRAAMSAVPGDTRVMAGRPLQGTSVDQGITEDGRLRVVVECDGEEAEYLSSAEVSLAFAKAILSRQKEEPDASADKQALESVLHRTSVPHVSGVKSAIPPKIDRTQERLDALWDLLRQTMRRLDDPKTGALRRLDDAEASIEELGVFVKALGARIET